MLKVLRVMQGWSTADRVQLVLEYRNRVRLQFGMRAPQGLLSTQNLITLKPHELSIILLTLTFE